MYLYSSLNRIFMTKKNKKCFHHTVMCLFLFSFLLNFQKTIGWIRGHGTGFFFVLILSPDPQPCCSPLYCTGLSRYWEVYLRFLRLPKRKNFDRFFVSANIWHIHINAPVSSATERNITVSVADPHLLLCGSGSRSQKMSIWIRGDKD